MKHCYSITKVINMLKGYLFENIDNNGSCKGVLVKAAIVLILTLLTTIGYDCMEAHFMHFFGRAFGGTTSVNNMYCVVGVRAVF